MRRCDASGERDTPRYGTSPNLDRRCWSVPASSIACGRGNRRVAARDRSDSLREDRPRRINSAGDGSSFLAVSRLLRSSVGKTCKTDVFDFYELLWPYMGEETSTVERKIRYRSVAAVKLLRNRQLC